MESELIQKGGASLRQHWNSGAPQEALGDGLFDVLVVQEQSTLPIKNKARFHDNVRLFNDESVRGQGKLMLYSTWCRKSEPDNQQRLSDAYEEIGAELGATIVPVGQAFQRLRSHVDLYDKDGSHCNLSGSYVAACCLFTKLFPEEPSPEGCKEVPDEIKDPMLLQKVAFETCSS